MKFSAILNLIKFLLSVVEQVDVVITQSKIPVEQQPEIEKEVDSALNRLKSAKTKIIVDPE
ncbi:MAG: hypothetical protein HC836_34550 [Richelia sp. RM2_1_2]|nr:hypothetical protein [Richelia sp. RM1_1_1]NJO63157.1 hypothetical protein [Richelia sp. RM2_1_2]